MRIDPPLLVSFILATTLALGSVQAQDYDKLEQACLVLLMPLDGSPLPFTSVNVQRIDSTQVNIVADNASGGIHVLVCNFLDDTSPVPELKDLVLDGHGAPPVDMVVLNQVIADHFTKPQ